MITIRRATKESRKRDQKRKRLILQVGENEWHITREEARAIQFQLNILL